MQKFLMKLIFTVSMLLSSIAYAASIESVFQEAGRYTVKIETTTEHPYMDDSHGMAFGAGFLVDKKKGWILTNRHVVADAPSWVEVKFIDSDYVTAEKIYLDPQVDLALIRIPTESIPHDAIEANLGCNEKPQMGNAVVIFGHPSGLNFTGTRGIISGTTFIGDNESLQTDAPLNGGNSGGPLISITTGKVVGVSQATFDEEESESLNLTVSIKHACKIISLIAEGKDPSPPVIPVIFIEHDLDHPRLAVAKSYYSDKSLLKAGDVITSIDGSNDPITNIDQLKFQLRGTVKSADIVIDRKGEELVLTLPLEPHPKLLEQKGLAVSGMTMLDFNPIDKREDGESDTVFVSHVASGSYAEAAWFDAWDSIYSINGERVNSTGDIYKALLPVNNTETDAKVLVRVPSDKLHKNFDYHELALQVRDLQVLEY
jgi:S1-C subfamily serine protease